MNPSEDILSEALRDLAATSPQGAPPQVGVEVKAAFARHHSRRRRRRIAVLAGLAACLLVSLAWLRISKQFRPDTTTAERPQVAQPAAASPAPVAPTAGAVTVAKTPSAPASDRVRSRGIHKAHRTSHLKPPPVTAASDFVALPMFDPAIPIGQSRMVRLELPGSALQLIGYPVDEELLERRVLTDVLVGQDGVPYAVRLVQTRSTH